MQNKVSILKYLLYVTNYTHAMHYSSAPPKQFTLHCNPSPKNNIITILYVYIPIVDNAQYKYRPTSKLYSRTELRSNQNVIYYH